MREKSLHVLGHQAGHEAGLEACERVEQGLAPLGRAGVNDQIAVGAAGDLHPVGGKAKLGGDAHSLAVAVHEHPAGKDVHGLLPCVYGNVGTGWPKPLAVLLRRPSA